MSGRGGTSPVRNDWRGLKRKENRVWQEDPEGVIGRGAAADDPAADDPAAGPAADVLAAAGLADDRGAEAAGAARPRRSLRTTARRKSRASRFRE